MPMLARRADTTGPRSMRIELPDFMHEATTRSGREQHTYRINPRDIEVHQAKAAA